MTSSAASSDVRGSAFGTWRRLQVRRAACDGACGAYAAMGRDAACDESGLLALQHGIEHAASARDDDRAGRWEARRKPSRERRGPSSRASAASERRPKGSTLTDLTSRSSSRRTFTVWTSHTLFDLSLMTWPSKQPHARDRRTPAGAAVPTEAPIAYLARTHAHLDLGVVVRLHQLQHAKAAS